jgi:phytoene dehydrogenase-like protein
MNEEEDQMLNEAPDVIVVGGGLAGLACAGEITRRGGRVLLFEASDEVGGRVRTDEVDGFLLDRGFQVLLEAYPECRQTLDYPSLRLQPFYPGTLVRLDGRFHKIADPARELMDAIRSVNAPVGTLNDKLRVSRLRSQLKSISIDDILYGPARSTEEDLRAFGFSEQMIDSFFRPFLGGILLDRSLGTPARLFRFYMRMFADGATSVPERGMGEIPRQLASHLPASSIRTRTPVARIEEGGVVLESGEAIEARGIVVATEGPEAARLLGDDLADPGSRGTTTLYFEVPESPEEDPVLILNGDGEGPVNHMAFMDRVSRRYAPEDRGLAAVNVLDDALPAELRDDPAGDPTTWLLPSVKAQLVDWFGAQAGEWRLIRSYRIAHAHPLQTPASFEPPVRPSRIGPGVWVAGDHRDNASINGAMASGRRAGIQAMEGIGSAVAR